MALIPRWCIQRDDGSDEEMQKLPAITVEERRFPSTLFGHQFAKNMTHDSNFHQLLKNFDQLEIYCDAPHESFYASTSRCSINVSIEEAFHFPQKICPRMPAMTSANRQMTLENIKTMWCRMVSHYFEWVAGIPELRLMDVQEKIKLVIRQLCNIICLTLSFWTYKHNHDGIVFASGIWFYPRENCDEVIRNYAASLATVIHTHVISTFRRLDLTREEYLLLKLVVLFEPLNVNFPPTDRLIVENTLTKYRTALVNHVKCNHPELPHEVVMERVLALFEAVSYLEMISEVDNSHLADIILRNNGNMLGQLTNDIHVNSMLIE